MNTGKPRPALFWTVLNFTLYMAVAALMMCKGLPLPENQGSFWTLATGLMLLAAINMAASMFQMFADHPDPRSPFGIGMGKILVANLAVAVLIVLSSCMFDEDVPSRAIAFCRFAIGLIVFTNLIVFFNERYPLEDVAGASIKAQ